MAPPRLTTERLVLRPFTEEDVPDVVRMAGNRAIADTTLNIPHPYGREDARSWIRSHDSAFAKGRLVALAIQLSEGPLVGCVDLVATAAHLRAELGYWVGVEHWNQGYATEASRELLRHAFSEMNLHRVVGRHIVRNPASGRVMEKLGMKREGILREHIRKWGVMEDIAMWAILRSEWEAP